MWRRGPGWVFFSYDLGPRGPSRVGIACLAHAPVIHFPTTQKNALSSKLSHTHTHRNMCVWFLFGGHTDFITTLCHHHPEKRLSHERAIWRKSMHISSHLHEPIYNTSKAHWDCVALARVAAQHTNRTVIKIRHQSRRRVSDSASYMCIILNNYIIIYFLL